MATSMTHIYKVYTIDWYNLGDYKTLAGAFNGAEEYWGELSPMEWVKTGDKWVLGDDHAIILKTKLKD